MKATEQYFPVVLFIMLYEVVLTFESVEKILQYCDYSNESHWAVLSCGCVYHAVQGGSNFWVFQWNPKVFPIQMKATEQHFPVVLFVKLYKVVLIVEFVDKTLGMWRFKWKLWSTYSQCYISYFRVGI